MVVCNTCKQRVLRVCGDGVCSPCRVVAAMHSSPDSGCYRRVDPDLASPESVTQLMNALIDEDS